MSHEFDHDVYCNQQNSGVGISFDGTVMMMDLYHDMQFSGIICLLLHLATHRQIKTTLLLFSQFSNPYFDILGLVWTECTYVSVCIYIGK